MARIIVVTGGVRSGKSVFAEKLMLDNNKKLSAERRDSEIPKPADRGNATKFQKTMQMWNSSQGLGVTEGGGEVPCVAG